MRTECRFLWIFLTSILFFSTPALSADLDFDSADSESADSEEEAGLQIQEEADPIPTNKSESHTQTDPLRAERARVEPYSKYKHPKACPMCKKKFPSDSKLERHSTVHTGDKPFACTKCSSRFTQNTSLKAHMKSQHSDTQALATCPECQEPNLTPEVLNAHNLYPVDMRRKADIARQQATVAAASIPMLAQPSMVASVFPAPAPIMLIPTVAQLEQALVSVLSQVNQLNTQRIPEELQPSFFIGRQLVQNLSFSLYGQGLEVAQSIRMCLETVPQQRVLLYQTLLNFSMVCAQIQNVQSASHGQSAQ